MGRVAVEMLVQAVAPGGCGSDGLVDRVLHRGGDVLPDLVEVGEAIREAAAAPAPEPDQLYDNVYGDEHWREQFDAMNTAAPFGERGETRSWLT